MDNLVNSARRVLATVREPHHEVSSSPATPRPDIRLQLESRQSFGPVPDMTTQAPLFRRSGSDGTGSLGHIPEGDEDEPEAETGTPSSQSTDYSGYYIGSYRRLQAFHAAIPILSVVCLVLLGIGPPLFFRITPPSSHPPLLPHPIPSLLLAASSWSLAYLLRHPTVQVLLYLGSPAPLPAALHAILTDIIRLATIPFLLSSVSVLDPIALNESRSGVSHHHDPTPHSPAFIHVWYLALGWSTAEVVAAVAQTYTHLALYADVLIPAPVLLSGTDDVLYDDVPLNPDEPDSASHRLVPRDFAGERAEHVADRITASPIALAASGLASLTEDQLEEELEALVRLKARQELEEVYGVPVVRIPVFISCLQRIASILFNLGSFLILSAAFLRSGVSHPVTSPTIFSNDLDNRTWHAPKRNVALYTAFPLLTMIHATLAVLHAPPVLARVGLHTAAYTSLVVGLGAFFAGLGMWEVLS